MLARELRVRVDPQAAVRLLRGAGVDGPRAGREDQVRAEAAELPADARRREEVGADGIYRGTVLRDAYVLVVEEAGSQTVPAA